MSYLIGPDNPAPSDEPHQHVPAGVRTCGPDCGCRHSKPVDVQVEKIAHEVPMSRSGFDAVGNYDPYADESYGRDEPGETPVFIARRIGELIAITLGLLLVAWLGLELLELVIEAYREVQDAL